MTDGTTDKVVQCPECGAANDDRLAKCWLCGADLAAGNLAGLGTAHAPPQFGLSSLFLILTLACVCLGLISIAPGLIVPLLVIVVPALIRTLSASQRRTRSGGQMTIVDKLTAFFTSLGIVFLIALAGAIAFFIAVFVACLATNDGSPSVSSSGLFWSTIVAILLMVLLFVSTWPRKK